jgi:hypothetical protein
MMKIRPLWQFDAEQNKKQGMIGVLLASANNNEYMRDVAFVFCFWYVSLAIGITIIKKVRK